VEPHAVEDAGPWRIMGYAVDSPPRRGARRAAS